MGIIKTENPFGVVVAFGGQTAIKLTKFLSDNGVNILGTSYDAIDMAEDRERFDELLEKYHIKRPRGVTVMTQTRLSMLQTKSVILFFSVRHMFSAVRI